MYLHIAIYTDPTTMIHQSHQSDYYAFSYLDAKDNFMINDIESRKKETEMPFCSSTNTVVCIIGRKKVRKTIVDGFRNLGDLVIDWYSDNTHISFPSLKSLPHRLVVMSYSDFLKFKDDLGKHLLEARNTVRPIIIFGRLWRRLPIHPAIIDGDEMSPDDICAQYWSARGFSAESNNSYSRANK